MVPLSSGRLARPEMTTRVAGKLSLAWLSATPSACSAAVRAGGVAGGVAAATSSVCAAGVRAGTVAAAVRGGCSAGVTTAAALAGLCALTALSTLGGSRRFGILGWWRRVGEQVGRIDQLREELLKVWLEATSSGSVQSAA
eukprot:659933-Prymnesium_polylepis.2